MVKKERNTTSVQRKPIIEPDAAVPGSAGVYMVRGHARQWCQWSNGAIRSCGANRTAIRVGAWGMADLLMFKIQYESESNFDGATCFY